MYQRDIIMSNRTKCEYVLITWRTQFFYSVSDGFINIKQYMNYKSSHVGEFINFGHILLSKALNKHSHNQT